MKDFALAFLPPLAAAILSYVLTRRDKRMPHKAQKGTYRKAAHTKDAEQSRSRWYYFFTFFPKYSTCILRGMLVFAISYSAYMVSSRLMSLPRIDKVVTPIFWLVYTANLICLEVGYQLLNMDSSKQ